MPCQQCGSPTIAFPLPPATRSQLPGEPGGVSICRDCLRREPVAEPPEAQPDFSAILESFPSGEAGATAALLLSMLDSLALYRAEIEHLAALAEEGGVDVFLLLDRIEASGRIEPHFDLQRRRVQLEQVLD